MIVTSCVFADEGAQPKEVRRFSYESAHDKVAHTIRRLAFPGEILTESTSMPEIIRHAQSARLLVLSPSCCTFREFRSFGGYDVTCPIIHVLTEEQLLDDRETYEADGLVTVCTVDDLIPTVGRLTDHIIEEVF